MVSINKIFGKEETAILKSFIGQTLDFVHHDEFRTGNLCIEKVGLYIDTRIYVLQTSFEFMKFLWGDEGVCSLHVSETNETGLVANYQPPIQYVKSSVKDRIVDVYIVRDCVEEIADGKSLGTFEYDKAVILSFIGHQIALVLDTWEAEMIQVVKSVDALSKLSPLSSDWSNDDLEPGTAFHAVRKIISLKEDSVILTSEYH